METREIMSNIRRLPPTQQMLIAKRIIHSIRKNDRQSLAEAATRLYDDYATDPELTVFTQLDCENFYDAR